MTKHINLQKNYSLNQSGYQLKLPLNLETIIPEDDSVRLLSQFVEAMDLTDLYSTYERINSAMPRTADAGYESEENYLFLEANGQFSYIKPANYEISKTRKYRNDIGKMENMDYDPESDAYTCKNGRELNADHIRRSKSKTGYISEKTVYRCKDHSGCPYKRDCIKGNNCKTPLEERTKTLQVAKTFLEHRAEDLERILSDEGILLRINRSIQAEGSFGD